MANKKTTDRFLKAKYHEGDFIQINISLQSVSISQASESGIPIKSYLTFEAIEELYNEIQQYKKPASEDGK